MPTNTDATVFLTEASAFHEARLAIERSKKATWGRFTHDGDPHDGYRLGKLYEALDAAEDAVFNALNVAASHLNCEASAEAIQAWSFRDNKPQVIA